MNLTKKNELLFKMENFLNITSKHKQNDNSKEENIHKFKKYDDSYLRFDFIYIKIHNREHP